MVFKAVSGNYDYFVDRTKNEDELDAIVVGTNMLREELKATTVSRELDELPAKPEAASSENKSRQKRRFDQPVNILVVDDNQINQLVAKKILENLGATVTLAGDGPSALKSMDTKMFDMIFMDIQMPDMDGYETATAIRARNFHNPIIALSANAFDEHIQKSIDAGMNGHLSKPFAPEQIYQVVTKHLSDRNSNRKAA